MEMALQVLTSFRGDIDICELCGGEARTSRLAVRRQLRIGENFDLVCGVDLNTERDQHLVERYFQEHKPFIAVMAPTCTPYGKLSDLNFRIHFDGWKRSYEQASPHARFCGKMALIQLKAKRHFFREQLEGTLMDEEPPWPDVLAFPGVARETVDQ